MKTTNMLAILTLAALMTGCVPSLHPLYTEKDVVFDPALVGTWEEKDGKNTWTFQKSGDKGYELVSTEGGEPGRFEAHLVQLGKYSFLDTYPEEMGPQNDMHKVHLIRAHFIWRIWREGDLLRIATLDNDWLKKLITEKKVQIPHEELGKDYLVLTAKTQQIQKLVLQFADDPKAFPDPGEFRRRK